MNDTEADNGVRTSSSSPRRAFAAATFKVSGSIVCGHRQVTGKMGAEGATRKTDPMSRTTTGEGQNGFPNASDIHANRCGVGRG